MSDGGPAFPVPGEPPVSTGDPRDGIGYGTPAQPGMSLRDWFAGQWLAGLGACPNSDCNAEVIAKACYQVADAMIAERGKDEK